MTHIKFYSSFFILTILFTRCGQTYHYEYWDISKFRLDSLALSDNEEIKLLYTSRGPDNNKELKYYIHVIAISQKTGDTVNILTIAENGFTMEDKDKVFNYFDQNNIASKLMQSGLDDLKIPNNLSEINKIKLKEINKVVRDPKFDHIADNNYPTVIGVIGILNPPNRNN